MTKTNLKNKVSLIPNYVVNQISHILDTKSEIPNWVNYYNPDMPAILKERYETKSMASDTISILYSEKNLINAEIEFLSYRFRDCNKINIFDLMETTGTSSIPFIFTLINENKIGKYIPVTPTDFLCKNAIWNLNSFIADAELPKIDYQTIVSNIETQNFNNQVLNATDRKKDKSHNLFLLTNSYLGNSVMPTRVIKNVYRSMLEGDYLVVSQNIYNRGKEGSLISDYSNLLNESTYEKSFVEYTAEILEIDNYQSKVTWKNEKNLRGVVITMKIQQPVFFAGTHLPVGKEIITFRANMFDEFTLKRMFLQAGLRLVEIVYDAEANNVLFILRK